MRVGCGMTKWQRTLFLLLLGPSLSPASVSAYGNIYQDAIPHLKACISLIQERNEQSAAIEPVDLRAVCPTLTDFLSYEPISEIDPPLENRTSRRQLESLVSLLEAKKQSKDVILPDGFDEHLAPQLSYQPEPANKPFFLALAHWTFSQIQKFLSRHASLSQPRLQHAIYITIVNLVMVICLTTLLLYVILSGRSSQVYIRYFKHKWQKQSIPEMTRPNLDEIANLPIHLQLPALIQLIKENLIVTGSIPYRNSITSAQILHAVKHARPQSGREITRLIRLYDRHKYSDKTVAADEIHTAFELARSILTTESQS